MNMKTAVRVDTVVNQSYDASRRHGHVDEVLFQDSLRKKRQAKRVAFLYGWYQCERCTAYGGLSIRCRRRYEKDHIAQHELYRALGIEDQFIDENAQRERRRRENASLCMKAMLASKRAIRAELKPSRDLRHVHKQFLKLTQRERGRMAWFALSQFGPITVIPDWDPALDHGLHWSTWRRGRQVQDACEHIASRLMGEEFESRFRVPVRLILTQLMTDAQKERLRSHYHLVGVYDRNITHTKVLMRFALYEKVQK